MPVREKGQERRFAAGTSLSHVPSLTQTAAKLRGFSPTAPGFTAETDSPLEGDGFEPSVPRKREHGFRGCLLDLARLTISARETDGSKPYPSASESVCR
jgi:hypothetical protein